MRRSIVALALAAFVCQCAPALATGDARDSAATRAYLRAGYAYARAVDAELGASVAAIEADVSQIAGACPSALTYAPRDGAFGEIGEEARTTAFWAGVAPARSATSALANAIGRLRWSSRALTRAVREQAAEERAIAALVLPNVCADIAAWKAGAYAALPQSTTTFLAQVGAIESETGRGEGGLEGASPLAAILELFRLHRQSPATAIMFLLRPYEGASERRAGRSVARLEAQVERRLESAAAAARPRLATTLGVSTL